MIGRLAFTRCVLALCLAATAAPAAADIVRCTDARGAITYQQAPCPDRMHESRPAIPSEYPAPNAAERDRLFQREAALDRRLEARRERELKEAQMREARAEREAERERLAAFVAAQSQPQYLVLYPAYGRHSGLRRPLNAAAGPRHNSRPIVR